jgi:zinc-binding alcohol dehydrogenase family protein
VKAIGYHEGGLSLTDKTSLLDLEITKPVANAGELLIKVFAVSVNPVDTKIRRTPESYNELQILGFDAVGRVEEVGSAVTNFNIGERVYYSGSGLYQGSNQEYQVMDARLVGHAPENLGNEEAAAMPLTSLTAYESLFEKMHLPFVKNGAVGKSLLIINGAGGVGSIAIQLANWAGLTVYATASRKETQQWVKKMGADYVINHHENIIAQVRDTGVTYVDNILILHSTEDYFGIVAELIRPLGHIVSVEETSELLPLGLLKNKSASFDWEFMFAKPNNNILPETQGQALEKLTELFENEKLFTTLSTTFNDGINASNLKKAHKLLESNQSFGKVVVSGEFNGTPK